MPSVTTGDAWPIRRLIVKTSIPSVINAEGVAVSQGMERYSRQLVCLDESRPILGENIGRDRVTFQGAKDRRFGNRFAVQGGIPNGARASSSAPLFQVRVSTGEIAGTLRGHVRDIWDIGRGACLTAVSGPAGLLPVRDRIVS